MTADGSIAAGVGLTLIITQSPVFEPVRCSITSALRHSRHAYLRGLANGPSCAMCVGFWVGLAMHDSVGLPPVMAGGLVSLAAFATAKAFSLVDAFLDLA